MTGTPPRSAGWPAPAKLNLFLHVLGRRTDGYHELETVFQLLDWGDTLAYTVRADGQIRRVAGPPDLPADSDLCVRAARRLQAVSGTPLGADIELDKRLPAGGGLGGGSSDAATTLVALNRLWGLDWSTDRLAGLGRELGADVPVFVHGRSAYATGVGEQLTPVAVPARWYAVVRPPVAVGTAEVFQAPELTRDSAALTIRGFLERLARGEPAGRNDCEPVVRTRFPEVAEALDWLGAKAPARLTGTGSCLFAACASRAAAEQALAGLPAGWQGFVAAGVDRSPLLDRLAAGP